MKRKRQGKRYQSQKNLISLLSDKKVKQDIQTLKLEEKYEEIFIRYGRTAYGLYIPSKYYKQHLKELESEGKYKEIYAKYGKAKYRKSLVSREYHRRKEEQGVISAALWITRQRFTSFLVSMGIYTSVVAIGATGAATYWGSKEIQDNAKQYHSEIEAYNTKIKNYAQQEKFSRLNDIQIIMKVMDDMWGSIQGYKMPEKDIHGFLELDLATEDGYGVCRNMAPDIAKKLNEINPKYHARVMSVYMEKGVINVADIPRRFLEDNETVNVSYEEKLSNFQKKPVDIVEDALTIVLVNHDITFVDIPEDNIILVVDPTNPSLGIYRNGQIMMFNTPVENGAKYDLKQYQSVVDFGELERMIGVPADYIKSLETPNITDEELEANYGLEAQNLALVQAKQIVSIDSKERKKIADDKLNIEKNRKANRNLNIRQNTKEDDMER